MSVWDITHTEKDFLFQRIVETPGPLTLEWIQDTLKEHRLELGGEKNVRDQLQQALFFQSNVTKRMFHDLWRLFEGLLEPMIKGQPELLQAIRK